MINFVIEENKFTIIGTPSSIELNNIGVNTGLPYLEYNNTTSSLTASTTEPVNGNHTLFTYTSPNIYDFKNNTIIFSDSYNSNINFTTFIIALKEITIKNIKLYVTNNDSNIKAYLVQTGENENYLYPRIVENCLLLFNLLLDDSITGGIIGDFYTGTIDKCIVNYVEGSIVPGLNTIGIGWIVGRSAGSSSSLTITNCNSRASLKESSGGLIGYIASNSVTNNSFLNIFNCHYYGDNIALSSAGNGGIVGRQCGESKNGYVSTVSIDRCSSTLTLNNNAQYCGGISGGEICLSYNVGSQSIVTISNCIFTGNMENARYSGGIVGDSSCYATKGATSILTITNCHVTSNFSLNTGSGGICGRYSCNAYDDSSVATMTITNCSSNVNMIADDSGGITSHEVCVSKTGVYITSKAIATLTISNCFTTGIIQGMNSGGICSYNTGRSNSNGITNVTIENCYTTGDIIGDDAGGICSNTVGYAAETGGSSTVLIKNCYSLGNIIGLNAGGICGNTFGFMSNGGTNDSTISCCYSVGYISGINAGGILGGTSYNGTITETYCLNWNNTTELPNDYGQGDMFGVAPVGIFTIANCSFNNGVDLYGFTPVTLQEIVTNSLCYAERKHISNVFSSTAPFLAVFGSDPWTYTNTIYLNTFTPTNYKYCPTDIQDNVFWPLTYENEVSNGICLVGNPTGTLERLCQLNGVWAPTTIQCTVCFSETLNNVVWPETSGGDTATGSCVSGNPTGALERTCQLNGVWENTTLECTECLTETLNYVSWPTTGGGDTAMGSCEAGLPIGTLERVCELTGIWEDTTAKCTGLDPTPSRYKIIQKLEQKAAIIICLGVVFIVVIVVLTIKIYRKGNIFLK